MNSIILTLEGRRKIKEYIKKCHENRTKILEAGLDTAEKIRVRSFTDIYIELITDPYIEDACGIISGIPITDHYKQKLCMSVNVDYIKGVRGKNFIYPDILPMPSIEQVQKQKHYKFVDEENDFTK